MRDTVRLSEQRRVTRDQRSCFDYAADFSNIEDWDPGVASSAKIGAGPVGVGTKYKVDAVFGKRTLPMIYEVTEYDAPDRVVLMGSGETIDARDVIEFRTDNGETVIDYTADLTFRSNLKYLLPIMGSTLRKVGERALDGLTVALAP